MPKDPKRVAAGKMAKRKGNKFEQEIAKSLCETYAPESLAGKLIDRPFRRTPVSGGFRRSNPADILCPPWFPFFIECKHRKDIDTAALLFNMFESKEKNYLVKLWKEERVKALPLKKELMIVFKKTMSNPLCMTTVQSLTRIDIGLATGRTDQKDVAVRYRCQGVDLVIVDWAVFLRRVSQKSLEALDDYLRLGDVTLRENAASEDHQAKVEVADDRDVRERYGLQ